MCVLGKRSFNNTQGTYRNAFFNKKLSLRNYRIYTYLQYLRKKKEFFEILQLCHTCLISMSYCCCYALKCGNIVCETLAI